MKTPHKTPRHTPGPWAWNDAEYSLRPAQNAITVFHSILELENQGMVSRYASPDAIIDEGRANRILIAAAPELLKQLYRAEEFFADAVAGEEIDLNRAGMLLREIRSAIKRATELT